MNDANNISVGDNPPNTTKAGFFSFLIVVVICYGGYKILDSAEWNNLNELWSGRDILIATCMLLVVVFWPFMFLFLQKLTNKKTKRFMPTIFNLNFKDFMTPWIAFWAFWGIAVGIIQANKQITRQTHQIETQKVQFDKQMQMQEKQLRETRFSSGVGLLGNANESARIGGAYQLYFLANEFPDEYVEPVCEILCAHIRTITGEKDYQVIYNEKPSNEIQTIVNLFFQKGKSDSLLFNECRKDFRHSFLFKIDFSGLHLNNVDFGGATISEVRFNNAELKDVNFMNATVDNATTFWDATLKVVNFDWASISDVSFSGGKTELYDVSFSSAKIFQRISFDGTKTLDRVNFYRTPLEKKTYEEITCTGCAMKLTTP